MRGSAKGREPEELRAWKELQRDAGIEPEYRALQRPVRDAMLRSLFEEQTGQCVYCGRGISLNRRNSFHVEHFRPRGREEYRALQLEYSNLFLSCGPEAEHGPRETCGHKKGDWFDEDCHIEPAPESCAERFQFRSSGDIAGDGTAEAIKMIEVLNLNHRELATERQSLIETLDQQLNEGEPGHDVLQDYLDTNHHGARPSFANVAIGYLNRAAQ